MQVSPSQQPVLQLLELHFSPLVQPPSLHTCPASHILQAFPPLPQAMELLPLLQVWVAASQQPEQELESHTQDLLVPHFWVVEHCRHWMPLEPQASLPVPGMQVSPLQQPPGQLAWEHLPAGMHCPWEQISVFLQGMQALPPEPQ